MTPKSVVLIADDEPLARRALRGHLATLDWIGDLHEVGDGLAAIRAVDSLRPHILFLDTVGEPISQICSWSFVFSSPRSGPEPSPGVDSRRTIERRSALAVRVRAITLSSPVERARTTKKT